MTLISWFAATKFWDLSDRSACDCFVYYFRSDGGVCAESPNENFSHGLVCVSTMYTALHLLKARQTLKKPSSLCIARVKVFFFFYLFVNFWPKDYGSLRFKISLDSLLNETSWISAAGPASEREFSGFFSPLKYILCVHSSNLVVVKTAHIISSLINIFVLRIMWVTILLSQ